MNIINIGIWFIFYKRLIIFAIKQILIIWATMRDI